MTFRITFPNTKNGWPVLVSLFICFIWAQASYSQTQTISTPGITLNIVDSLREVTNGDLVGVTVMVENNTLEPLKGVFVPVLPAGFSWMSPLVTDTVHVAPQERRFLSVRFRITQAAESGQSIVKLGLRNADGRQVASAEWIVVVQQKRAFQLLSLDNLKLMRHRNDSITVAVQVRNNGNTSEDIQIVSSLPTLTGARRYQTLKLNLAVGADTTLNMGFVADRDLFAMDQFQYNVIGLFDDQSAFGNVSVNVQNASSSRVYRPIGDPGFNWSQRENRVAFSARNPFSDNQSLYLDVNMQLGDPQQQWEFNSTMYQWGDVNQIPVLSNTWLSYTHDKSTMVVGNIFESVEKHINGRGAKFGYLDTAANYEWMAGVVDRSYDLLNQYGRDGSNNGLSAFGRFRAGGFHPDKKQTYSGTILYDKDPWENAESVVHASIFPLIHSGHRNPTHLSAQVGVGYSRALVDSLYQYEEHPSMALGIDFTQNYRNINISSTNYYSTGYYPGTRRGSLQLNQRIGWRVGHVNLWGGYNLYQFSPKSFMGNQLAYDLHTEQIELGLSWNVAPLSNLTITPNRQREQNLFTPMLMDGLTENVNFESYRLRTAYSWRSRNSKHAGSLSWEGSTPTEGLWDADQLAYRSIVAYNFWKFNLNVNYQEGVFSVFELINNLYQEENKIRRLGANVNFNHQPTNKLRLFTGLQYYKDSYSGTNQSAQARVDYSVGLKTAVFAQGHVYQYRREDLNTKPDISFQVGITQSLAAIKNARQRKGDLKIVVYYDHNYNGVWDEGDELAVDKSVLINKALFLSDAEGIVNYIDLPYGMLEIQIPLERGWHAPVHRHEVSQKREQIMIPLQRSGTVNGQVVFDFDPRLSLSTNTNLEGYTITALSATGAVFQTRTTAQGNYMLFLPEGEFSLSMNVNEFPEHVYAETPRLNFTVEAARINELPPIVLKVRERKIEVRRFGSPVQN